MTDEARIPEDAPTVVTPPAARDDGFDFDLDSAIPPPPPKRGRRPFLTTALALCAAIGIGVIGGILIQKHWGGSSGSGAGTGRAAAFAALAGRSGGAATSTTARAGGGFLGRGGTGGGATIGQVKAIDGTSLYVTDLQGNTVKITTGPGVQVRVTSSGTLKKVLPGDYVTVQGTTTSAGVRATSITDSGTQSPFGAGAGAFGGSFGGSGATGGQSGGAGGSGSSGGGTTSVPALPGLG